MIAIDTNIIVRLLANDDPDQTARALRLLKEDRVFVASTVILETEWVLRSAYRADRGAIQQSLRKFLALPNVFIENEYAMLQALEAHAAGMDLARCLASRHRPWSRHPASPLSTNPCSGAPPASMAPFRYSNRNDFGFPGRVFSASLPEINVPWELPVLGRTEPVIVEDARHLVWRDGSPIKRAELG